MNSLSEKLLEVFKAIVPIVSIVILLSLTLIPITPREMITFGIASLFVMLGLAFFLIGVDLGVVPLGSLVGQSMVKKNKLMWVMTAAFALGFIVSVAEPGLLVLGQQIQGITQGAIASKQLIVVVSLGIGCFMCVGFLRLIYNIPLRIVLIVSYGIVGALALFTPPAFLAIAFDASGSTTGILAVPFILTISVGVAAMKKDSKASEKDSFGLIAIVSVGAILSVLLLSLFVKTENYVEVMNESFVNSGSIVEPFIQAFGTCLKESFTALLPLIGLFLMIQMATAVKPLQRRQISFGLGYALIGLTLFFVGVNTSFMSIGNHIGAYLVRDANTYVLVAVAFVLGAATILAEPAVHILTEQIEEITSGHIKKTSVLMALAIGVGIAVALSALRVVVKDIQLWHYLLPGYTLCIILTFLTPQLFVGIGFDAGGVATGPVTATFILAFINGAANEELTASLLIDGFGMIAMVALMPIITLQVLGLWFKLKAKKEAIKNG